MLIENLDELGKLNDSIASLLQELDGHGEDSPEYAKMVDQLVKLVKTKELLANIALKNFEATAKKEELERQHELKLRELLAKKEEVVANNGLKRQELTQRIVEHDETFSLRKRELELKQNEFEKPDRLTKDAMIAVAANLAGIAMIIGYERVNVIASKALGFIMRAR